MPIQRRTVRRGPVLAVALVALSVVGFGPAVRAFAQDAPPDQSDQQDPPSRVGYISLIEGTVSMHATAADPDAADNPWAPASINYPMTAGTSLWTEPGAKAEIQIGAARIDLDGGTEVDIVAIDDQNVDINVPQGRADIHLHGRQPSENYEATLPRGTAALMTDGTYRLIAGDDQAPTRVGALYGSIQLLEPSQTMPVATGNELVVTAGDPLEYTQQAIQDDDFDRWVGDRMHRFDRPPAHQYVSPQVVGAESLDQYGTWQNTPQYGAVWTPSQVNADWAPYREGHWRWVAPWGWTWVDDEPWGFAPFHYGRWAQFGGRWGWVPGTVVERPVYAPAMVAFVGGEPGPRPGVGIAVGIGIGAAIGWVPLGPREVYRPPYHVSERYLRNVNVTNVPRAEINHITINRTTVNNVTYVNQRAVTVVNHDAFVNARPVRGAALPQAQAAAFTHPIAEGGPRRRPDAPAGAALPQPTAASRVGAEGRPGHAPPQARLQMPQTRVTTQGRVVPTTVPAAAVRPGPAATPQPNGGPRGGMQPGAGPQPNAVPQPHPPNQPAAAVAHPGMPPNGVPQPNAVPQPHAPNQPAPAVARPGAPPTGAPQPSAVPQPPAPNQPAPAVARPGAPPAGAPQPNAVPQPPAPNQPAPAITHLGAPPNAAPQPRPPNQPAVAVPRPGAPPNAAPQPNAVPQPPAPNQPAPAIAHPGAPPNAAPQPRPPNQPAAAVPRPGAPPNAAPQPNAVPQPPAPNQPAPAITHLGAPPNAAPQPRPPNQPAVAVPRPGPQPQAAPHPQPQAVPQVRPQGPPHPAPQAQPQAAQPRPQPQQPRPVPQARPQPQPQQPHPQPQAQQPHPQPQAQQPRPQVQQPRPQPQPARPAPHPEEKKKDEHPASFRAPHRDDRQDKRV